MKKQFTLCMVFIGLMVCPVLFVNAQSGGVAVNGIGTPPDPSALFDVSGTNKGLLMPRMSSSQRDAISSPAAGLTIFNTDCNVYNYNAGTPSSPVWATVNATNALIAGVSISANPTGAICAGTNVTFTASPSSGINAPAYQWKINGVNAGTNSDTFSDTALVNGDVVTCVLSTGEACVTGSPATSNAITMTVNPIPSTPGSITGNTSVCAGTTGNIYSISPVAGATSYNWTVPGDASIASGSGNTSITVTFGTGSGNVSVIAVNGCGASAASSQAVSVTATPSTPGSITGANSVCANATSKIYSISAVNQATSYNWTVPSGATITVNSDTTISVNFASNPAGNVAVSASNFCGTSAQSILAVTQSYICAPYTFSYTGGLQSFTVPSGVTSLTIEAYGAQGGNHAGTSTGGNGADIKGTFTVTPGQLLNIIVGGQGVDDGDGSYNGGSGGGGGSFVYSAGPNLLIAAGGGGGGALIDDGGTYPNGDIGQAGNCGSQSKSCWPGGCSGNNGSGNFAGNGWNTIAGNPAGIGYGGYGGGGTTNYHGGGGGGGYSGGGGGSGSNGCGSYGDGGGGGGSYNTGTNQTNTGGVQSGNGQVVFTW